MTFDLISSGYVHGHAIIPMGSTIVFKGGGVNPKRSVYYTPGVCERGLVVFFSIYFLGFGLVLMVGMSYISTISV